MGESHLAFYRRWSTLAGPYFKWQLSHFKPFLGTRIADVGCGLGNFVDFFKDAEIYLGFEPDAELAAEFLQFRQSPSVRLSACGDITQPAAVEEMRRYGIDTVLHINVLEHIREDRLALSNMIKGLKVGGHACLLVPALPWLYGTLDTLDGHFRRYTKKKLLTLAPSIDGVQIVKCRYINFPGAFGWFLKGRVFKQKKHSDNNYKMMNAILPAVSFIESRIEPPIGLSLVLVLKKTHE